MHNPDNRGERAVQGGQGLEYVGFWPRVLGSVIDSLLLSMLTVPLLAAVYGWGYFTDIDRPFVSGPADVVISWVAPAVITMALWLTIRATPGKLAIRSQVVDADTGETIAVSQAVLRYVGYVVAMVPMGLGLLWVAFDPRRQGWHDKIAGTVVVRPRIRGAEPVRFDRGD